MSMQLPTHLYGQLSRTRMGCVLLVDSGCLESHVSALEAAHADMRALGAKDLLAAKTSLWALVCVARHLNRMATDAPVKVINMKPK
jgi:hypothetical protein